MPGGYAIQTHASRLQCFKLPHPDCGIHMAYALHLHINVLMINSNARNDEQFKDIH